MGLKAGFIGLGHMGTGMSKNVLKAAGALTVFDLNKDAVQVLVDAGATAAASGAEVMKASDVVFLSLPAPQHVRSVVAGEDGLTANAKEGDFIIDLSTIDPKTSMEMAEAAKEKGVIYVDVPVSGGMKGANGGTLSLMAGAREEELAPVQSYIDALGKTLFVNERGFGSAFKVINNLMGFSHLVIDAECILLAEHLGISDEQFFEVVSKGSGYDEALHRKKAKVLNRDYEASFAIDLVVKDMELGAQMFRDMKLPLFTGNTAIQIYRMAQQMGYGNNDNMTILKMLREIMPAG